MMSHGLFLPLPVFAYAEAFNGDVSAWDVSKATDLQQGMLLWVVGGKLQSASHESLVFA